ncbi:unnamed protein product [Urochloa decumbens]|uniref:Uncharacterized protein n=1 Tax=Urochloa decumbens TaxID=240449 RepID=A0ABC8VEJ3_9POAL
MWACRPFLCRPRTLLDSIRHRRVSVTVPLPVVPGAASRCNGDRPDATKDKAVATSPRCNGGGEPEGTVTSRKAPAPDERRRKGRSAAAANRSPPAATVEKKHLFLVLDDAKYGFGIHKLDIDAAEAAANPDVDVAAAADDVEFDALPSLPNPPVMSRRGFWRRHGGWRLPFRPDGHICACEVPRLMNGVAAAPEWKLGKEKLFVQDSRRRWGKVLPRRDPDGAGSGQQEQPNRKGRCAGDGEGEKCVLRLSTFRVEYDADGELVTADRHCRSPAPAGSFSLSRYHEFSRVYPGYWQAFWA